MEAGSETEETGTGRLLAALRAGRATSGTGSALAFG